jgi:hypothetical protein
VTCALSTPRRPKPPRRRGSRSSTRSGAACIPRSASSGRTPGRSSSVPGLRRRDPPHHLQTNAIESLNARYRRAVRARGHFPNDAAALKCLYLVTRSLDPTAGQGTLGDEVEARTQRLRDHLRRPNQLMRQARSTVNRTHPPSDPGRIISSLGDVYTCCRYACRTVPRRKPLVAVLAVVMIACLSACTSSKETNERHDASAIKSPCPCDGAGDRGTVAEGCCGER